ncbi:MAG: sugar ABC transporter permease [Pelagibacteraceae bacterium]|nr:sugar ABC transporter permease [Pelagibacteraceae bacterium]MDC0060386.1 ABC transporter permease subunit [Pelagibacteraceae bacterium]
MKLVKKHFILYLFILPTLIFLFIFHYLPIYESKLAFQKYKIIGENEWVGLRYFKILFSYSGFYNVLWNTIIISMMKIVFTFPIPIILALTLNEVRKSSHRKFFQSILYIPHFLSWVIISGIFISMLSINNGAVNNVLQMMDFDPINFLTNSNYVRWILVISEIWRSAGWDSVLYIAAIFSINQELYDSAKIDGATRWQQTIFITLPMIVPMIITVFILNLGFFLSAGFDQVFNLMNAATLSKIDIIDTYVYRIGLLKGDFSLSIAAGLFKGLIGFILIMSTHFIAKKISGRGLW